MSISFQIIKIDEVEDFSCLVSLFANAFEMTDFSKPGDRFLGEVLKNKMFVAIGAKSDNKIIGGLTGYVLNHYFLKPPLFYLYDLAVAESFRRKGVATALIQFLINYCRHQGFGEFFVQADSDDHGALRFYRTTNPGKEQDVIHFTYPLARQQF